VELLAADSPDIRVAGIVHKKVIPENQAAWLENSEHLPRHLALERRIEDRREDCELSDEIERFVAERELSGAGAH
jgi:hypothetical protein